MSGGALLFLRSRVILIPNRTCMAISFSEFFHKKNMRGHAAGYSLDRSAQWTIVVGLCVLLTLFGVAYAALLFFMMGEPMGEKEVDVSHDTTLSTQRIESLSGEYQKRTDSFNGLLAHPPSFSDPSR